MGDKKLTRRQRQILDFLAEFEELNGYSPSYREIADHFGLSSPATIHEHIKALEEKGFLRSSHSESRSIELVHFKPDWTFGVELSLAGLITAGEPIEAIEDREKVVVPKHMVPRPEQSFVLKVKGDSMIEDGILDGDLVICQQTSNASDGDTVVALVDRNYATLKRFYREGSKVRLQPANENYQPIYPNELAIQGKVIGLIRSLV